MYIKSFEWIDEESREAEVTVSDGQTSVICFSHPFNKKVNEILIEPIYCLDAENIIIVSEQVGYAKKNNDAFGYLICGKLVEKHNCLVLLGDIKMCLEDAHIPMDIPENSFIEFHVSRLSIY